MVNEPRSLAIGEASVVVTRRLFPSGAPWLTIDAEFLPSHAFQPSIIACRSSFEAFLNAWNEANGALQRIKNFFMGESFLGAFSNERPWVVATRTAGLRSSGGNRKRATRCA